jgi:hypothetical protein
MKIIKPAVITDSMIVSSTVPEPSPGDGTLWSGTAAYAVDTVVYRPNHLRYRAIVAITAPTTGTNPAPESGLVTPAKWQLLGPTLRYAMFDDAIGSVTSGPSPLVVVVRPGSVGGVPLLEMAGRTARVEYTDSPGGTVVYDRLIDLDGTIITDVYDWFFAEFEPLTDVVLTDLPGQYPSGELKLTITSSGADAAIGAFKPGTLHNIGDTQYGATVGILDFSKKDRDVFGRVSVLERDYSKRASFSVMTEKLGFNRIFRLLASLRATPCVYIGTEEFGYEPLLVYGFYRDFSIDVAYPTHHLCSLEVEGMTQ